MNVRCKYCKALFWASERLSRAAIEVVNGIQYSRFGIQCCGEGEIILTPFCEPPEPLKRLFTSEDCDARQFRKEAIYYNNAFSFTSCKCTPDQRTTGGLRAFSIRGEVIHYQGPLYHANGQPPRWAQIYFYDPNYAEGLRLQNCPDRLRPATVHTISTVIYDVNPFIRMYKTAREVLDAHPVVSSPLEVVLDPQLRLLIQRGADRRRENLPISEEIAVIIADEWDKPSFRDTVLAKRHPDHANDYLMRTEPSNASYMPLCYPLLFPYGDPGWTWSLRRVAPENRPQNRRISARDWFRYQLHKREGQYNPFFTNNALVQKYVVDAYAQIDQGILDWNRRNQTILRADLYQGVVDALATEDLNPNEMGRRVILPASYHGGARYMHAYFQDVMAVQRRFGHPHFWITFTANPQWPEFRDVLGGNYATDHPHIAARIWEQKLDAFLDELKTCLGQQKGIVWNTEWQKRGLPHAHLLVWIENFGAITPEKVNEYVCAELPDNTDPILQTLVSKFMVYGPCGQYNRDALCMKLDERTGRKICTKNYPKAFQEETTLPEDGYPLYRRRNNGRTCVKHVGTTEVRLDNRWVVPYNPYLIKKFVAHINTEICMTIFSIKYMFKYMFKGDDRITVGYRFTGDEIEKHLSGRYIGSTQAAMRITEQTLHQCVPAVQKLFVHLPGQQPVYFGGNDPDITREDLEAAVQDTNTTLTCFFEYNRLHPDGRQWLYHEFPEHFVYHSTKGQRRWTPRQRQRCIGRMVEVSHRDPERARLRLLLTVVRGSTSYENLRTVDGTIYPTFTAAAIALGLLEDDNEWIRLFEHAITFAHPLSLRNTFACILLNSEVRDPADLWERFKRHFCQDAERELREMPQLPPDLPDPHLDFGLYKLDQLLRRHERRVTDFGLPAIIYNWDNTRPNSLLGAELNYEQGSEQELYDEKHRMMNDDQLTAFDAITTTIVRSPAASHFFVQGPAGTGKTFLYSVLCHYYRSMGSVVLCVASSGVAALLLPGGQTSHSRFHIPLQCEAGSVCTIGRNSDLAGLLRQTKLIIWDEVPMQHKATVQAVDRTLRDILQRDTRFGGIPVVFGGDFAQTCPVVPKGNRHAQVSASLRSSELWPDLQILRLRRNMRIQPGYENETFAKWIAEMSYNPECYGRIELPDVIQSRYHDAQGFTEHIYPKAQLECSDPDPNFYKDRAILTPRNDTAAALNAHILSKVHGNARTFYAVEHAEVNQGDECGQPNTEYLQKQDPSGFSPSILQLKVGAPVILLRNLLPKIGLCNGTRLFITRLHEFCIEARILGGQFDGERRLLHRIKLSSKADEYPWVHTRKQFPIRLCFAITINKSQGQSLNMVGVDLRTPCFSHGQLYVALSRVTDVHRLSLLFDEGEDEHTANVVYPEVLV